MYQTRAKLPSKAIKRSPALGVNFEYGENGAVTLYVQDKEFILGMIPEGYAINANAASAIGSAWKTNMRKPLSSERVKSILDNIQRWSKSPKMVTPESFDAIIPHLENNGSTPVKA